MVAHIARLSGDEWQEWANLLLSRHYGPTEYQKVPDNQKGDAGIEGFTRCGRVYQAYGCEEPISTDERYTRQRDKLTADVGKFIRNKAILEKLFGSLKVIRWALFVPFYDSRELVARRRHTRHAPTGGRRRATDHPRRSRRWPRSARRCRVVVRCRVPK